MGRIRFHCSVVIFCAAVALLMATPLMAGVEGGTANFEVYLGSYQPDDPYESDLTFGLRGGGLFTDHFGMQGTLGYFESHSGCCMYGVDYSTLFTELSAIWYVNPENLAVFMVYGGSGLNFANLESNSLDYDKLGVSFHGGVGLNIALGEVVYLRPDARLRWISKGVTYDRIDDMEVADSRSTTDYEFTLALGFTIGR